MSSLLFPSHRLFVAAVSDEDGRRSKRPRSARVINLSESAPRTSPADAENTDLPPYRPVPVSPPTVLRPEW